MRAESLRSAPVLISRRLVTLTAALALGAVFAAGCGEQAAALRVGDTRVSRSDLEAELDAFASSEAIVPDPASIAGELPGSYTQDFVGDVLMQRIEFTLAEQVFDGEGLELTDSEISATADQVGQSLDAFPEGLRESLIEDLSRRVHLQNELGAAGYSTALREAADAADIDISSRYGSWDGDNYTVQPPDGPAPEPG